MKYPKIGIRPIIDGRWGGVRESLENQTMNMAKSAKELIENNLFYSDGTPAKCVISNTTIGGAAEASQCQEQFATENVIATLSVTPCWCYVTETMDMDPNTIKAVWGFNGTERPGAVYLSAVLAAHAQYGLPAFSIYGKEVQDAEDTSIPEDVKDKILRFARSALAVGQMKDKSCVNLGGPAMGIVGSNAQASFFHDYLGMRTEWVDMTEILRRMKLGIYDQEEFERAYKWTKENCKEGININDDENLQKIVRDSKIIPYKDEWEFVVKHALICRDIILGNPKLAELGWHEEAMGRNGILAGFQGQRQWTDWLPNADFTESILASSFDWNGKRENMAFATENDTLNGTAMLFEKLLTNQASMFSDVRTFWSNDSVKRVTGKDLEGKAKNGVMHLINSGASCLDASGASKDENGNPVMKKWFDMTDEDIKACLDSTDWEAANHQYFRGGGFSSHFYTNVEMPVTMARINIVDGVGPVLQIAEGYTCAIDKEISQILEDRTDKTWPTTWFAPRLGMPGFETVYDVMANWGANHGATTYGHIGADLITLASMLRIPVSLHNIEDKDIFRPHSFKGFGTKDLEASDYRACKFYGARFK